MRYQSYSKIDTQIHTMARSFNELEMLKHCNVTDLVSTMFIPIQVTEAGTFRDLFNWLINAETKRGKMAGLNIHPAVGIHPMNVPVDPKVLDLALKYLEEAIKTKKCVAVGETGLEKGTQEEFISFKRHLEIASNYNLPVIIHTPYENKVELTKLMMQEIKKTKIQKAVIDHVDKSIAGIVLQDPRNDIKLGMSIQSRGFGIKEALELYKNYSYENRFVMNSDAGSADTEILSMVQCVEAFEVANVNSKIIQKLCHDNALDIFRGILSEESLL